MKDAALEASDLTEDSSTKLPAPGALTLNGAKLDLAGLDGSDGFLITGGSAGEWPISTVPTASSWTVSTAPI